VALGGGVLNGPNSYPAPQHSGIRAKGFQNEPFLGRAWGTGLKEIPAEIPLPMSLTGLLSLVSTLAIVAAGVFAGIQVRQLNKQRARDSALQLAHSFQTPEFVNAVNIVFDLPENLSRNEIESRLGDSLIDVLVMFGTFESLGILVYRREIDISLVDDYCGGVIVLAGRRFKRYLTDVQESSGRATYYEWFQWLCERFEERESAKPAVPAFVAHRDWKR